MPIARHVAVFDMTADSHLFRTVEDLAAEGITRQRPPPCFNCDDDAVLTWLSEDVGWEWVGYGMMADPYPEGGGRIYACQICREMLRLATEPHCMVCATGPGVCAGWCTECAEEYAASLFGDYPPPTNCGCAWHNIYIAPLCELARPATIPLRGTRKPTPPPPEFGQLTF